VPLKALLQRWQWTTLLAVAAFAVLFSLDTGLKAATGFGTVDLQSARTAAEFTQIFSAWIARQHSATAGFSLGFDFLFIFLYVNAFYYSAIMMIRGATDDLAGLAFVATNVKTVCFVVGLVLLAVAAAGFFKLRAPRKAETD
jgi:hypothetical protein